MISPMEMVILFAAVHYPNHVDAARLRCDLVAFARRPGGATRNTEANERNNADRSCRW